METSTVLEQNIVSVSERLAVLKKFFLADPYLESAVDDYKYGTLFSKDICFISFSDGNRRAEVISGSGYGLSKSYYDAQKKMIAFCKKNKYDPLWIKVDFINDCKFELYSSVKNQIADCREFFYKRGISFDVDFNTALLEAQLNCGGFINYKLHTLKIEHLREFFASTGKPFSAIPSTVITFTTIGYIIDENNDLHKLYPDVENYGRRIINDITKENIGYIIHESSKFLSNNILENGRFNYGINPVYNEVFTTYNILRHTGTIWSIIMQYDATGDESLIPKIESTINYLMESIEQPDDDHAYLVERKADEIKLGGNAVAIITLSTYMEIFNTDKYKELVRKIANSILDSQEPDGSYYHVLSFPGFEKKERDRIVYYDGEATFALAKAYGVTKDDKYLNAAKKALDYFIENDYYKFADHWVAYSVNEVTKYYPEDKYFSFGLRNANENLSKIFAQDTTFHTFLELLMAAYELYKRIKEKGIYVSYMQKFNFEAFIKTIYKRAHYMLNGFLYPEIAMYMQYPLGVVNTFCVRHDSYRIRIDDVQHYIGGYYNFYRYFDELDAYYKEILNKPSVKSVKIDTSEERSNFVKWILNNI